MSDDLRRRVVRALGASSAANGIAKLLSLAATLVLARLLTPADFGLMATATTLTGLIGFFNEVGIGAAIVQRKDLREAEVSGCFGIALLFSTVLCAATVLLSWPAAEFMAMPGLQPVLAVLGGAFYFGALNTVHIAMLRRELRLQATIWLGLTAVVVQSLVSIPLALAGWGHWALVGSFFVGQTVATIWYWRVSTWRPTWPLPLREGRALLGYGLNITYTRVMWHLYMNVDKLIVGKLLGASAVGIYDVSRSLASLPTSQITGMVTGIASPVFARMQNDPQRLGAVLLRFTRGLTYLTAPALLGIAVVAPELVAVLLGPKWQAAVLPLQALCVSELVAATLNNLQAQFLVSTGQVKRLVRFTTLCTLVMPLAVGIGAWQGGLIGVAIAWACVYPLLNLWLVRETLRVAGLSAGQLWAVMRQPLLGSLFMLLCVQATRMALHALALPDPAVLAAGIAVGALSYVGYLVLIDRSGLTEIAQVLADFGVPPRWLDRWPLNRGRPLQQRPS
jgi:O-antigen/teichoic acid export membrane protein